MIALASALGMPNISVTNPMKQIVGVSILGSKQETQTVRKSEKVWRILLFQSMSHNADVSRKEETVFRKFHVPGLKKIDLHPVTGWVRIRGCFVTMGSRRTVRPMAMDPSA